VSRKRKPGREKKAKYEDGESLTKEEIVRGFVVVGREKKLQGQKSACPAKGAEGRIHKGAHKRGELNKKKVNKGTTSIAHRGPCR